MTIFEELQGDHKSNKHDGDINLPDTFFMNSPLFKGKVTLDYSNLSYTDNQGEIRIKEKNELKLLKKIRRYGYVE